MWPQSGFTASMSNEENNHTKTNVPLNASLDWMCKKKSELIVRDRDSRCVDEVR